VERFGWTFAPGDKVMQLKRAAIRLALASKALIITGGPGVGKTTIVNSILRILGVEGSSTHKTALVASIGGQGSSPPESLMSRSAMVCSARLAVGEFEAAAPKARVPELDLVRAECARKLP
jgi:hypothetical protein